MKIRELIQRLQYLESQNGDLNVIVNSDKYYLDIHKISDVREENDKIQIILG